MRAKTEKYEWYNHQSGETFTASTYEMGKRFGVDPYSFSRIINEQVTQWKGWTLRGRQLDHYQGFRYRIRHEDHGVIEGTQKELCEQTGSHPSAIHFLLTGEEIVYSKGWVAEAIFKDGNWEPLQSYVPPPRQPMADATKLKIGEANRYREISQDTRRKMSEKRLGRKMPEGTGAAISARLKGRSSPLKGRKFGTNLKKREAATNNWRERKASSFRERKTLFEANGLPFRPERIPTREDVLELLDSGISITEISQHYHYSYSAIRRMMLKDRPHLPEVEPAGGFGARGNRNPNYNPRILHFKHFGGHDFKGTQWEFRQMTGISSPAVAQMITGEQRHGWRLI